MGSLPRIAFGLLVWTMSLFGVLQVGHITGHGLHQHSICGPWGCGPPTAALVGWHGFWLLLAGPPVGFAVHAWPAWRLRNLGLTFFAAGLVLLVGTGICEAMTWLPKIANGEPSCFVQRYLFSVVTMTDVPVIPVTLSGIVLLMSWRAKRRSYPPVAA
jgi:hypothetical protein